MRLALGILMGLGILAIGVLYLRSIVTAPPPEPDVTDVSEYGLRYVCAMCGLELKIEVAAKDRPPTHCGEPRALVRTGGKPPLTPV